MKKKIAGVLTTVLAASLLVGGNHPVTVQVDNMISGTQDDEDTQSDEAEAEETLPAERDGRDRIRISASRKKPVMAARMIIHFFMTSS